MQYYYELERDYYTVMENQTYLQFANDDEAIRNIREIFHDVVVIYRYKNADPNDHDFEVIWEKESVEDQV